MRYAQQWLLAVALKRDYPRLETGAEENQSSSKIVPFLFLGVGAIVGWFVGDSLGQEKGFESGKLYAKNRAKWREEMGKIGIDPDAAHMRGIYD